MDQLSKLAPPPFWAWLRFTQASERHGLADRSRRNALTRFNARGRFPVHFRDRRRWLGLWREMTLNQESGSSDPTATLLVTCLLQNRS
ncbi:hypothetical protein NDU88_002088, partial [Pleurodeles waltl]